MNWKKFLTDLFYEGGNPSLTRVMSAFLILLFAGVSLYLVIKSQSWQHYEVFATVTAGGGALTQVANKVNNSINNSPKGEPYNKNPEGGK